jgi:hypothetical protein
MVPVFSSVPIVPDDVLDMPAELVEPTRVPELEIVLIKPSFFSEGEPEAPVITPKLFNTLIEPLEELYKPL